MALLEVIEYPDPRLRLVAAPVTTFDDTLGQLIDDLIETMQHGNSIGLSAPQVGDLRGVVVMQPEDGVSPPLAFVNPEILAASRKGFVEESCMSLPDVVGNVIRATRVTVRARDRHGETFERDLEGMDAVCLQHEMDHLAGKLFIDRLAFHRRLYLRAKGVLPSEERAAG